jgi:ABC-type transport system involved in cytochrome c biogenesis permease subunit
MQRRWNWLPLGGFLLSLVAFFSYYLYFAYIPATRDIPWLNLLLFAGALLLIGAGLRRAFGQPQRYRGRISGPVFAVLSVAILSFFLFYNFSYSQQLPESKASPKVGALAPDFTLPDKNDQPVTLSKLWGGDPETGLQGQWVLLVFYRGYW